jgi:hypothetical protein
MKITKKEIPAEGIRIHDQATGLHYDLFKGKYIEVPDELAERLLKMKGFEPYKEPKKGGAE